MWISVTILQVRGGRDAFGGETPDFAELGPCTPPSNESVGMNRASLQRSSTFSSPVDDVDAAVSLSPVFVFAKTGLV